MSAMAVAAVGFDLYGHLDMRDVAADMGLVTAAGPKAGDE